MHLIAEDMSVRLEVTAPHHCNLDGNQLSATIKTMESKLVSNHLHTVPYVTAASETPAMEPSVLKLMPAEKNETFTYRYFMPKAHHVMPCCPAVTADNHVSDDSGIRLVPHKREQRCHGSTRESPQLPIWFSSTACYRDPISSGRGTPILPGTSSEGQSDEIIRADPLSEVPLATDQETIHASAAKPLKNVLHAHLEVPAAVSSENNLLSPEKRLGSTLPHLIGFKSR